MIYVVGPPCRDSGTGTGVMSGRYSEVVECDPEELGQVVEMIMMEG